MSLHSLDTMEQKWKDVKKGRMKLLAALESFPGRKYVDQRKIRLILFLQLPEDLADRECPARLSEEFNIQINANPKSKD